MSLKLQLQQQERIESRFRDFAAALALVGGGWMTAWLLGWTQESPTVPGLVGLFNAWLAHKSELKRRDLVLRIARLN